MKGELAMSRARKSVLHILLLVIIFVASLHSAVLGSNSLVAIRRADMFHGLVKIIKNYSSLSILQEESNGQENVSHPEQTTMPQASPTPNATKVPTAEPTATAAPTVSETPFPTATPIPEEELKNTILVYFHETDMVRRLNIEEYVLGVLAAEMSDRFELEALKAQAVAIRTNCYYSLEHVKEHKDGAVICTDSSHCQAFSDEDYSSKYVKAVTKTEGIVIKYDGEYISANYFYNSGGYTEDSSNVWGGSGKPYLVAVSSPGEEAFDSYYKEYEFSMKSFAKKSGIKGASYENITDIDRSSSGGINSITINGKKLSGRELRSRLDLRSTKAYFKQGEDGKIIVEVYGYGHGVGMSQCGAQAMALEDASYKTILTHYYTGVKIRSIN
ncbi:MAG: stage II sporulation protein D [Clostridia bacterium]|nr:stage II sporulation protein D [Clostridia bacterium]